MCVFDGKNNKKRVACSILLVKTCRGDKCSFRMTEQEYAQKEEKTMARLAKLPREIQRSIANKYYYGKAVWNN